jgi:hypothetical protein
MDRTQVEAMEISRIETMEIDISKPIQTLFDECLSFISVTDFNM